MNLQSLPATTVLSDYVTIVEQEAVKIVRILHPKVTGGVALHGGHVVSFQPEGEEDYLWMSAACNYDGKAPLRGGIPVCWPWFGPLAQPSHGFARAKQWQLVEHRENDEGVIVELGLTQDDETLAIWPYSFSLRLVVEMSTTLKVSLIMTNTGDTAWNFSGALHSYLNIGDIEQLSTTGMGPEYIDKLQDSKLCQGEDTLILTDTIDRVYTQPSDKIVVTDPVLKRQLTIENAGHNSAVLWNPWQKGAASIGDMNEDSYKTMFCVESTLFAPHLAAGRALQPNESHTLSTVIAKQ